MWYNLTKKHIYALSFEETLQTLANQGADPNTLNYIRNTPSTYTTKLIGYVKNNIQATTQDLQNFINDIIKKQEISELNAEPTPFEIRVVNRLSKLIQPWALIQLKKLRYKPHPGHEKSFTYKNIAPDVEGSQTNIHRIFERINDWVRFGQEENPNFQIATYDLPTAYGLSEKWHDYIAGKGGTLYTPFATDHNGQIIDDRVVATLSDGWFMVNVNNKHDLAVEGKLMNHCVGGYWSDVKSGNSFIYSLRDPDNLPHATIELDGNPYEKEVPYPGEKEIEIKQVKGDNDKTPHGVARKKIAEWFASLNDVIFHWPGGDVTWEGPSWEAGHFEELRSHIYEEAYGTDLAYLGYENSGDWHEDYQVGDEDLDFSRDPIDLNVPELLSNVEENLKSDYGPYNRAIKYPNSSFGDNGEHDTYEALAQVILDHDEKILEYLTNITPDTEPRTFLYQGDHSIEEIINNPRLLRNLLGIFDLSEKYQETYLDNLEDPDFYQMEPINIAEYYTPMRAWYDTMEIVLKAIATTRKNISDLYRRITGKDLTMDLLKQTPTNTQRFEHNENIQPKLLKPKPFMDKVPNDNEVEWIYSKNKSWYKTALISL